VTELPEVGVVATVAGLTEGEAGPDDAGVAEVETEAVAVVTPLLWLLAGV
jgi:hypothetical protein